MKNPQKLLSIIQFVYLSFVKFSSKLLEGSENGHQSIMIYVNNFEPKLPLKCNVNNNNSFFYLPFSIEEKIIIFHRHRVKIQEAI